MVSSTLVFIQPVIALVVDLLWEDKHALDGAFFLGAGVIAMAILVSLLPKIEKQKKGKHGRARFTKGPMP